jgi:intracellular septation protein
MKEALSHLASDLLSAILFFAIYLITGNIIAAAAIAIVVGLAQVARMKLAGRPIEPMQWMILGLVVVLGTATMLTQSPGFMMVKPSIGHFAVAAIMLRRGWMIRYLPDIATQNLPESVLIAAGYAWAALLAAIGIVNLGFAAYGDVAIWAWWISFGAIGAKLAAFALQYAVFRTMIRRRLAQVPA